jgi:3-methyladenine DNA glycosylase AlkD
LPVHVVGRGDVAGHRLFDRLAGIRNARELGQTQSAPRRDFFTGGYPKTTPERRKEFYDLYMRRHDRINNWDLCDLGCLHMIGCHLFDKPRQVLYKMAKSKNIWERRTAILGTCYFIRQGEVSDTFKIGELLLKDKEDLIHKATGWMLRFAGSKDQKRLLKLLDKHAATMPRTLLRSCIEGLSKKQREHYMKL